MTTELTKLKLEDLVACPNIAELLDEQDLHKIGYDTVKGFENDLQSRSAWEKKTEESMKLALQVAEAKSFPWPGASNVKFPLITIAALQYHARSYPVLVDGEEPVKCRVIGDDADGDWHAAKSCSVGQPLGEGVEHGQVQQRLSAEECHHELLGARAVELVLQPCGHPRCEIGRAHV